MFLFFNGAILTSMGSKKLNNTRCAEFLGDYFFVTEKWWEKLICRIFLKHAYVDMSEIWVLIFPSCKKNYRSDNLPFYCKRHKNWILPDKCAGLGSHTCILYFTQCTKLLKRLRILCSKKLLYKLCNQQHKLHVFIMYMYVILFWHTYKLHTIRFYKKKVSKF